MTRPRGFLAELKRRRVVRVALVYLAVAFIGLQAADILVPALLLPGWTMTLLVVILVLGFIAALALTWVVDLTPDGVVITRPRDEPEGEGSPVELSRRAVLVSGTFVMVVVFVGAALLVGSDGQVKPRKDSGAGAAAVSVAVLPFTDLSDDRSQEYFGDGLAEELLNTLRVAGIDVASRTSSFAFNTRGMSVRQIAQELGVDHIIEGSVRKAGDRLRISARLIDVRSDRTLWSDSFDFGLEDIFATQSAMARAVASALRVRLGGSGEVAAGTEDAHAYELYLLGLYHWHRRTPADLQQALRYFTAARDADPRYARAWAGIAFTYNVLPDYTDFGSTPALRLGREAAERAVQLDPRNAEARTALAWILQYDDGLERSLEEYDRAIALDPMFATAHHWRGILLMKAGRLAEAEASVRHARRLDPASPAIQGAMSMVFDMQQRIPEALAEAEAVLERVPDFRSALNYSFLMAAQLGRAREYEQNLRAYFESIGEAPDNAALVVAGLEDPGQQRRAVAVLDAILERNGGSRERFHLAGLFATLGAREQALHLLEMDPDRDLLGRRSYYAFLRDDPRYRAIMERGPASPPDSRRRS
jgi:TolB-like protein